MNELDVRKKADLVQAFDNAEIIVSKNYLQLLSNLEIVDLSKEIENVDITSKSRFLKINKLVYNKNEDNLNKLTTILNSIALSGSSIVTIIKGNEKSVDYYMGVVNKDNKSDVSTQYEVLEGTLKGNFTGIDLEALSNKKFNYLKEDIFNNENENIVTSVSGVSALRLRDGEKAENYIQGLEKLVDSVKGKNYTMLFMADPLDTKELNTMRLGYENIYSQISPFQKTDLSFNESDTLTFTDGVTESITNTINTSISYTQNTSETNGWSNAETIGNSKTKNQGQMIGAGVGMALGTFAGPLGMIVGAKVGSVIGGGTIGSSTESSNYTNSKNYSKSISSGQTNQSGESEALSTQNSTSTSEGKTSGRTLQISYENRSVKTMLEKIDKQIERVKICEDSGAFKFAAYIISNDSAVNKLAASTYSGLMKGEDSSVEASYINTWYK